MAPTFWAGHTLHAIHKKKRMGLEMSLVYTGGVIDDTSNRHGGHGMEVLSQEGGSSSVIATDGNGMKYE